MLELTFSAVGFGLAACFGFGLADCSGAGVGDFSEIGAGKRCEAVVRISVTNTIRGIALIFLFQSKAR